VAIRIARRDARRYKWRSALIVTMVGLPVLLLTGGITLIATNDVSLAESVPRVMGSAQARVYGGAEPGRRQIQSPNGRFNGSTPGGPAVLTVPGFAPESAWTGTKIERLTAGRVIRTLDAWTRVTLEDRRPSVEVLGIDARDRLARGMTELDSGRWASTPSEVVVTKAGIASGLPSGGTLTTTGPDGKSRQLAVVGVATGYTGEGQLPFLVALPDLVRAISDPQRMSVAFLIERADPVTWSDVRRMNDYGLLIQSREVFLNPPPVAELDAQIRQSYASGQSQSDLVLLLAAVGLFIETTLLAGPAFAVSAARQRRSLALAASNGAEARQLRRYVLGQAVVLGVLAAAIAVVAGVLLSMVGLTWWQAGHADFVVGPFEVSWPRVVGVFICAVLASVIAALLPAKGVARLDIVSVLAGVAVMVLSGMGLIWAVATGGEGGGLGVREYLMVVGAIGLVLGCLMVIPALLSLVGRLGTRLALPLRLAARDTARQRGRSTPAVAAIMAAVAALTALSIGAASNNRENMAAYQPERPMGTGSITFNGQESDEGSVRAVLDRFAPQLEVERVAYVASGVGDDVATAKGSISWVSVAPPSCTESQILGFYEATESGVSVAGAGSCVLLGQQTSVEVGNIAQLSASVPLSTSQRSALEGGGILVTDRTLVQGGQVGYVAGTVARRSTPSTRYAITQRVHLPAVVVDPLVWGRSHAQMSGSWILPETAARLGWPVRVQQLTLTSPTGTITPEVERAVADRLGDGYRTYVERGYQDPSWLILLIAFSVTGLLVLIASLISTALSLAESQNDMATLAAVGATRHTRRGIAASQALVVAAAGSLLGVAVGLVPGIASTWPLTVRYTSPQHTGPTIEIPWLPLLGIVVVVPLLAGALAWLAVRRHPQMTRRLA